VWWCRGSGAILADGLWAGQDLVGAVVNLSRELAPRLSVDRTKILGYREENVDRLLWQAVTRWWRRTLRCSSWDWLYYVHPFPAIGSRTSSSSGHYPAGTCTGELGGDSSTRPWPVASSPTGACSLARINSSSGG